MSEDRDGDDGLHALLCAVDEMRAELVREIRGLREDLRGPLSAYARLLAGHRENGPAPAGAAAQHPPQEEGEQLQQQQQLVTLDQVAAVCRRSKRTLERYRGAMPAPRVKGARGRAALWGWGDVRPWAEAEFGLALPEVFPSIR